MRKFVYVIIFFSFFDLFAQLPIISPFAQSLGATPFLTGLAVGMYSLSNTVGNVISGFLTDKKGPYHLLVIGLVSTGIVLLFYSLTSDAWSLLMIRFLHGFAAGLIVPAAFTYIANSTAAHQKGKGSAISGAFVGIAAIVGPAFSGIIASRTSEVTVLSITGIMMFLLGVSAFFTLRQPITVQNVKKQTNQLSVRSLFQNRNVVKSFAGAFFLMFSQGVLAYLLPLKAIEIGYDVQTSGLLLSTFGIIAVLIFILPTNKLFDHLQPINTFAFGMITMGTSLIFISIFEDISYIYVLMGLYGVGFAFLFPSINKLLIESTKIENRGKAYGYFYAFFSIGVIVGSGLIGFIGYSVNAGFLFTGIFIIIAASMIRIIKS